MGARPLGRYQQPHRRQHLAAVHIPWPGQGCCGTFAAIGRAALRCASYDSPVTNEVKEPHTKGQADPLPTGRRSPHATRSPHGSASGQPAVRHRSRTGIRTSRRPVPLHRRPVPRRPPGQRSPPSTRDGPANPPGADVPPPGHIPSPASTRRAINALARSRSASLSTVLTAASTVTSSTPFRRSSVRSADDSERPIAVLGRDERLGVRTVVDQADLGQPVQHAGCHIVRDTPLPQRRLPMPPAAGRRRSAVADRSPGDCLRITRCVLRMPTGLPSSTGWCRWSRSGRTTGSSPSSVRSPDPYRAVPSATGSSIADDGPRIGDAVDAWSLDSMAANLAASSAMWAARARSSMAVGPAASCSPVARCGGGVGPTKFGAATIDQKSTGAGTGSSRSMRAPTPSFSLMRFSISLATSGFSRRNVRTFSLPWPSCSPS